MEVKIQNVSPPAMIFKPPRIFISVALTKVLRVACLIHLIHFYEILIYYEMSYSHAYHSEALLSQRLALNASRISYMGNLTHH